MRHIQSINLMNTKHIFNDCMRFQSKPAARSRAHTQIIQIYLLLFVNAQEIRLEQL